MKSTVPIRKILALLSVLGLLPFALTAATPPTDPEDLQPLGVDAQIPAVTVQLANGEDALLTDLLSGHSSLLVFYRGGWCPFCTGQFEDFLTIEEEILALGYQIYGISPDSPASIRAGQEAIDLPFTLLSDSSMTAAQAFRLAFQVDEAGHERLLSFGIDIEAAAGEPHRLLPIPAVYLIDQNGQIQFAHHDRDYRQRLSAEKTLQAARELSRVE